MTDNQERLKFAQWVLERNLAWIAAAEVKIGVVMAVDTAMLGALATAFGGLKANERSSWANLSSISAGFLLLCSVVCVAMALFPRTQGPKSSSIFFGCIVKDAQEDFSEHFRSQDAAGFLQDCLDQVYRNSEIACAKFGWVRRAMMWSFLSVLPWTAALALLIRK